MSVSGKIFGLALVDLTTGDFLTTELENDSALLAELERLRPAEIIFPTEAVSLRDLLRGAFQILSGYDDWTFAPETAFFTVKEHFKVASLDGFGLKDKTAAIGAAGGALHYLTQNLRRDVKHLTRISFYQRSDFLTLDYTTLRHLEILEPQHHDAPRNASLYGALNKTVTPMGARLLRNGFRNRSPKWNRFAAGRKRCKRSSKILSASTRFASSLRKCAIWNARLAV